MKLPQLQKALKEQNIDCIILKYPDPHITYFSCMEPSHAYFLITSRKAQLYVTQLDAKPAVSGITCKTLDRKWQQKIGRHNFARVGINKSALSVASLEVLQKIFSRAEFIDVSSQLETLRLEKTPTELKYLRKAGLITTQAFHRLLSALAVRQLKTEKDVAFFLEKTMCQLGAQSAAFPTIAAIGKNAAIPHHVPTTQRLKRGFLLVDFGARYRNYCADMTRVVFLGKPTQKEEETYNLLLKAQQSVLEQVQTGVSFQMLDNHVRKALGSYEKFFIHSLGHGIGIEVHEAPVFSQPEQKVKANVPFTIEPGIYLPGKFGLRIEDTVIWDGSNVEILTKAPKDLISINRDS